MDKLKLEKLYEKKGLYDYKIKTIEELCEIHYVKLNQVYGYNNLNKRDKQLYKEFLINYFNIHKLENRNIIPLRVFRVLEEEYVVDDFKIRGEIFVVKRLIYKINPNNEMELYEEYVDEEYVDSESRLGTVFSYLSFVCVENGRHICIHIKKKDNWY